MALLCSDVSNRSFQHVMDAPSHFSTMGRNLRAAVSPWRTNSAEIIAAVAPHRAGAAGCGRLIDAASQREVHRQRNRRVRVAHFRFMVKFF
jgi:hypothetical protein